MHEHPRLGQGEGREHAHCIQRNEEVGVALEDHDQERGQGGQYQDAVREVEPVAAQCQLPGGIAVPSDD